MVITQTEALLWTDGRYFLQAERELAAEWTLMRMLDPGVPEVQDWLRSKADIEVVGVDASLFSVAQAKKLQEFLAPKSLRAIVNPVDRAWGAEQPPMPKSPVYVQPLEFAGVPWQEKVRQLQSALIAGEAAAVVVSMLDEVAWLFNIRGGDIEFNPVTVAYAVVTQSSAHLFVDEEKLDNTVKEHLRGVELHPYVDIHAFLRSLADQIVWADDSQNSWSIGMSLGGALRSKPSLIALPKSIKNEAELRGIRAAHIRDGVALTAFLHWLNREVTAGSTLTEHDVALKIGTTYVIVTVLTKLILQRSSALKCNFTEVPRSLPLRGTVPTEQSFTTNPNPVILLH